ncbi:MAG: exodeoxyribonuclease V subunit gamma, partial [Syntrophales bacterium LBB04]|nr:exodeoxyribonuclease V subunit gamma [Syntrophales bacterium LBB04]
SYSKENFEAAQGAVNQRREPRPFIGKGLSEPSVEWKTIDLNQFNSFFENPARFFLHRRLGIYLDEEAGLLDENEPFHLSGLERVQLEQDLVKKRLQKQSLQESFPAVKASGQLPHGTPGKWMFDQTCQDLESFARTVLFFTEKGAFKPQEVDLNIEGFRFMGRIDRRYPDGVIHYRYARMRPQDRLRLWIELHLLNLLEKRYK